MQILSPPRRTRTHMLDQTLWRLSTALWVFTSLPGDSQAWWSLKSTALDDHCLLARGFGTQYLVLAVCVGLSAVID